VIGGDKKKVRVHNQRSIMRKEEKGPSSLPEIEGLSKKMRVATIVVACRRRWGLQQEGGDGFSFQTVVGLQSKSREAMVKVIVYLC
jgi:hypothetical protein